jgi:hypothetical protein
MTIHRGTTPILVHGVIILDISLLSNLNYTAFRLSVSTFDVQLTIDKSRDDRKKRVVLVQKTSNQKATK